MKLKDMNNLNNLNTHSKQIPEESISKENNITCSQILVNDLENNNNAIDVDI
jgi:hypothetical protein